MLIKPSYGPQSLKLCFYLGILMIRGAAILIICCLCL